MRLLPFYLCLLAISFQAVSASSSSNRKYAALNSKKSSGSKPKKVAGKLVKKKKLTRFKKNRAGQSKDVVVKENTLGTLVDLLLFEKLAKLVIDYLNDGAYSAIVSTHRWLFKHVSGIAVDSARAYVLTYLEGLKGLNHSLANLKEDERRCIEIDGPNWLNYNGLSSSCDGQYVSFSHEYMPSTGIWEQAKRSTKWLTTSDASEDGMLKRVAFDGEDAGHGLLSRDGQTLCSYNWDEPNHTCSSDYERNRKESRRTHEIRTCWHDSCCQR